MMGLLDMASPEKKMQQPQQKKMGGLLDMGNMDNMNSQNDMPQNEGDENDKMLNEMLQNPTVETVQKIIEQISANGNPESRQVIPILEKLETPEQITQFATLVQQKRAMNE